MHVIAVSNISLVCHGSSVHCFKVAKVVQQHITVCVAAFRGIDAVYFCST